MSRETLQWLNTNTLISFTENRAHAWHWRAQDQHGQSNRYPGAIPLQDVQDRLFHGRPTAAGSPWRPPPDQTR